jgi:hypothetical protein
MRRWLRSVGCGPHTSMLSNATSPAILTEWTINQRPQKGRHGEEDE